MNQNKNFVSLTESEAIEINGGSLILPLLPLLITIACIKQELESDFEALKN